MTTIGDLLSKVWDLLVTGFKGICDAFIAFGDWLVDSAMNLVIDFAVWVKEDVFMVVFASISSNPFGTFVIMQSEYLSWANYFLPVSEFFGLLYILLSVWLSVFLLKITLKLIPTVY